MKHKVDWGPGFRLFRCDCGHEWKDKSRHCESPSTEGCHKCDNDAIVPYWFERHYEWATDKSGNLLE